jgi:hypothetical protein
MRRGSGSAFAPTLPPSRRRGLLRAQANPARAAQVAEEMALALKNGDDGAFLQAARSRHAGAAARGADPWGSPRDAELLGLAAKKGMAGAVAALLPLIDEGRLARCATRALHAAASHRQWACAKLLAPLGDSLFADKDHDAEPWRTAMHFVAVAGEAEIAGLFLAQWTERLAGLEARMASGFAESEWREQNAVDSDLRRINEHAHECLGHAAAHGHLDCARMLLPLCRAPKGQAPGSLGVDPLLEAAERGCAEGVRLLLARTPLDRLGPNGHSALGCAVRSDAPGNRECVQLLLAAERERGLSSADASLWRAALNHNAWAVRELLPLANRAWRADQAIPGELRRQAPTALMALFIAAPARRRPEASVVELLAAAFDSSARNEEGLDAFGLALAKGHDEAADVLSFFVSPQRAREALTGRAAPGAFPRWRAAEEARAIGAAAAAAREAAFGSQNAHRREGNGSGELAPAPRPPRAL